MTEQLENTPEVAEKPKRGPKPGFRKQSAAGLSITESTRENAVMSDSRDPNEELVAERIRVPLGSGQDQWMRGYKLDEKNFHYHMFHESATRGGRVAQANGAFYEHCQIGGENIKRPAGNGWDYLMRIPRKYWQEDMEASRARREKMRIATQTIKGGEKLQEYGIDTKTGRPVFEGEAKAKRTSTTAHNPYSE